MDYRTALAQLLSLQADWGSLSQAEKSARYEQTRAAKRAVACSWQRCECCAGALDGGRYSSLHASEADCRAWEKAKRERMRAGLRRCGHAHGFAPAPEAEGDER